MIFVIYTEITGDITRVVTGPADVGILNSKNTELPLQITDSIENNKYYVDITVTPHELKQKISLPFTLSSSTLIADGIDEIAITGLPNPVTVTWPDNLVEEVTDGIIEFSVDQVGTYTITIESIPYLTEVINVEAIPVS